jgi:TrmH family RNA methyltransferase
MSAHNARLISSVHNPNVKQVVRLDKRSEREEARLLPVEGPREVSRALAAGHLPLAAYVCPERVSGVEMQYVYRELERLDRAGRTRLYIVTPDVYARLAVRESSGGILLVIPYLQTSLDHLGARLPSAAGAAPFLAVVENAEKPGNLGAILRTADAAGVHAVIACHSPGEDVGTDVHNPNTVRASLGTIFSMPLGEATTADSIAWLRARGIRIAAATPEGATLYTAADLRGPLAVVLGSEAHGLTRPWLDAADLRLFIPMYGQADSLNLAASAAVLLYEVLRQRQLAPP